MDIFRRQLMLCYMKAWKRRRKEVTQSFGREIAAMIAKVLDCIHLVMLIRVMMNESEKEALTTREGVEK